MLTAHPRILDDWQCSSLDTKLRISSSSSSMRSIAQGSNLRPAQNILQNKRLLVRSHHLRVRRKNFIRWVDWQVRQRITPRELLS
jgi:hypothetical protein